MSPPSPPQQQQPLGRLAPSRIPTITGTQVQALLFKLDVLWHALAVARVLPLEMEFIEQEKGSNDLYAPGEVGSDNGAAGKHVWQEVSILGHLQLMGALDDQHNPCLPHVAVELGAGTGRLSDRLSRVLTLRAQQQPQQQQQPWQFVLVDRRDDLSEAKCRDRVIRARQNANRCNGGSNKASLQRLVMDIADLDLADYFVLPTTTTSPKQQPTFLCMSKHLCGPACDMALASIGRYRNHVGTRKQQQLSSPPPPPPPVYCAVATCCHYLCSWHSFESQLFWTTLGLTEEDFVVAVAASQWASLNNSRQSDDNLQVVPSREAATSNDPSDHGLPDLLEVARQAGRTLPNNDNSDDRTNRRHNPLLQLTSEEFERTFSREQKAKLGWKLKQLLDLARASHLQQVGYKRVKLVRYTSRSIDDRLLLAW